MRRFRICPRPEAHARGMAERPRGGKARRLLAAGLTLTLAALAGQRLEAQLPSASAAALGMGDNFTAAARGFNAPAWNPAVLGLPGNPPSGFALLSARGISGLDPVTLGDLKRYEGAQVPESVRRSWLDLIVAEGGERGSVGTDLTFLAAHAGRFAVQLATTARAVSNLHPGAAELLLFGNAGLTGEAQDISLGASSFDVLAASTAALSYAQPLLRGPDRSIAVGATVKYTMGHLMYTGVDVGSEITADPLAVRLQFPILQTDTLLLLDHLNNGGGMGVDLGAAWSEGPLSAGLAVRNVFNNFEWDEDKLYYRAGEAILSADSSATEFRPRPASAAPAGLRARAESSVFEPLVSLGVSYRVRPELLVTADFRQRFQESRMNEATTHVGAGAEYRPLAWLPLRAGGAVRSDGYLVSAGAGVQLGVLSLTAAAAHRDTRLGVNTLAMFTFSANGL